MESNKVVGYALLVVGLAVVVIPAYYGLAVLFQGSAAIPKILVAPVLTHNITSSNVTLFTASDLNQILGSLYPGINLGLVLTIVLVMAYAGGVVMSRGVSLIKETKPTVANEDTGVTEVKKQGTTEPMKPEEQKGGPPSPESSVA